MIKKYIPRRIKHSIAARRFAVQFLRSPIKVWYWRSEIINFGDELTPDIIERLFKKKVVRVEVEDAELFAVGSILEVADRPRQKKAFVWGSGFIEAGEHIDNPNLIYCAARGSSTRDRLPAKYKHIPLGDPGLLSNLMYKQSAEKTNKIGIIPHFVDIDNAALEKAKNMPDVYSIISVQSPPEDVARQITECRVILSSSLHGLIVADSFGIPNRHLPLSDKVHGGEYKFRDYYSAVGKEYTYFSKDDLYNTHAIDDIVRDYTPIENLAAIQHALMQSFPFK